MPCCQRRPLGSKTGTNNATDNIRSPQPDGNSTSSLASQGAVRAARQVSQLPAMSEIIPNVGRCPGMSDAPIDNDFKTSCALCDNKDELCCQFGKECERGLELVMQTEGKKGTEAEVSVGCQARQKLLVPPPADAQRLHLIGGILGWELTTPPHNQHRPAPEPLHQPPDCHYHKGRRSLLFSCFVLCAYKLLHLQHCFNPPSFHLPRLRRPPNPPSSSSGVVMRR